ncbi:hypothetical protein IWW39_003195 [Coemansia spiralis]|uniref:Uncharacterized protein n=1 Tax=Coemansia spiralis TaxID=417178 RepID=A0A9W8GJ11_9FUNG|nr:hypothetical protein IWW39_003195 [Coemansia spiralis]
MPVFTLIQADVEDDLWDFDNYDVSSVRGLVVFVNSIVSHDKRKKIRHNTVVKFFDNPPSEGGTELSVQQVFDLGGGTVYFTITDGDALEENDDALEEDGDDGHEDDD